MGIAVVSSYGPSASGTTHDFTLMAPHPGAECQRLELDFSTSPGAISWYLGRDEASGSPEQRELAGSTSASQVPGGAWGATVSLGGAPLAVPSYLRVTTGSACQVTCRLVSFR